MFVTKNIIFVLALFALLFPGVPAESAEKSNVLEDVLSVCTVATDKELVFVEVAKPAATVNTAKNNKVTEEKVAEAKSEDTDDGLAFLDGEAIGDEDLDGNRGAFNNEMLGLANLEAAASGNTNIGGNNGSNIVSDAAFNGTNGLVTTIQNSGNNVIIQNSTVLNVKVSNDSF